MVMYIKEARFKYVGSIINVSCIKIMQIYNITSGKSSALLCNIL